MQTANINEFKYSLFFELVAEMQRQKNQNTFSTNSLVFILDRAILFCAVCVISFLIEANKWCTHRFTNCGVFFTIRMGFTEVSIMNDILIFWKILKLEKYFWGELVKNCLRFYRIPKNMRAHHENMTMWLAFESINQSVWFILNHMAKLMMTICVL